MFIFSFLAFILFIKSIGDIGLHILRIKDIPGKGLISFSFGFVITSYILRLLFSCRVTDIYTFTIIICLILILNIRRLSEFLKDLLKIPLKFFKEERGIFERLVILSLFIQIVFNFFISLTPPTAWDALSFHLAIPKLIIEKGSMVDLDYYAASRHPLLVQMIFTLTLLVKGEQLVHLVSWLTGLLTIVGIYSLSKMLDPIRNTKEAMQDSKISNGVDLGKAGLIGGAIFYCTQVVSMWTSTAYIDIYLAFFSTVSLSVILIYLRTRARGVLILGFIFISILPGIKENGIFLALIMGVFLMANLLSLRPRRFSRMTILIIIFIIIFIGANIPWYYQFERNVSGTGSILTASDLSRSLSAKGIVIFYFRKLSFALWNLTIICDRDGRVSPLFLTFIPFLFLVKGNYWIKIILTISLAYIGIFSFFKMLLPRYVLPIMPFLSLVSAYMVWRLLATDYKIFRLLKLYIIFTFVFNFGLSVYNHLFDIEYLTGKIKRDEYIARKVSCFRAIDYINKNIKIGRILLLGETRSYYLERDFLQGRKLGQVPRGSLLEAIRNEGITHILASPYLIYKRRPDIKAQEILDEVKDKKKTIYEKDDFGVYQLLI